MQMSPTTWIAATALAILVGCSDDDKTTNSTPDEVGPVTLIAADRTGNLYSVDAATGVEAPLLTTNPPGLVAGDDIGVVSSMLYVPQTAELWLGMGGNSICGGCIMTLDIDTGNVTLLRDNSTAMNGIPDLALRADDGAIFLSEGDGSDFYEVNPTTGELTFLGNGIGSSSGSGITFASDGTLYLAASETLYEVDPDVPSDVEIGEITLVGLPEMSRFSIGSMTTRPSDGAIFGILKEDGGSGGSGPTFLVRVDVSTAQVTNVGQNTNKLDGLAFVPESLFD